MSLKPTRVLLLAYVAATACAFACNDTISVVEITPDGGGDAAPASDAAGPADATEDSDDDAADALAAPDGSGYVPDLGRQSGAYQINASHTGSTDDTSLYGSVSRRWEKDFTGAVAYPLIAHGKVIATSITADGHGALQAFDAVTGSSVWGPVDLGPSDISSSAYDGGQVFALSRLGRLQAFDVDTGALHWTVELGDPATPEQFLAAPTAYGGRVYVVPTNYGKVRALDEMTGTIAWRALTWGDVTPAVTDTGVFLMMGCDNVYRLDPATGATMWQSGKGGCSNDDLPPVVGDASMFATIEGDTQELDIATGAPTTPGRSFGATMAPAIDKTMGFFPLIFTVYGTSLPAVTGGTYWNYRSPKSVNFRASPMVAGGNVHVLWDDCTLQVFDRLTGNPAWSDSEPSACADAAFFGGVPTSIAAAASTIAVPYRAHLVVYGVTTGDAGADAASD
jgi:outer membrane protein assembly factor BamB